MIAELDIDALDLFAGVGWGVACTWLGIREKGVELMAQAVATREAAGFETVYYDVWDGLEQPDLTPAHTIQIASPPCQTFSAAGAGAGRLALHEVLSAIGLGYHRDVQQLRLLERSMDPRTALVLTPLAHVYRDLPTYVVWEQVPPVLPVWEACADVLVSLGYSVWTGILNAEQYGVPQTRRRAILMARRDGKEARPPAPTHSRYYPRDPSRLDDGVLKWVSMAEALGWGEHADLALRSNYGTHGDPENRGERAVDGPAATITSKANRSKWVQRSSQSVHGVDRAERDVELPSLTITSNSNRAEWKYRGNQKPNGSAGEYQSREVSAPAPTIGGSSRSSGFEGDGQRVNISVAQAAALQSFPDSFPFQGTQTKKFLQIGNAVPPLLAAAILQAVAS